MEIVVEYSKEQNAFHRCPKTERDANEKRLKEEGRNSTYIAIATFDNYEKADRFIDENYNLINNCRMYKNDKGEMFAI